MATPRQQFTGRRAGGPTKKERTAIERAGPATPLARYRARPGEAQAAGRLTRSFAKSRQAGGRGD